MDFVADYCLAFIMLQSVKGSYLLQLLDKSSVFATMVISATAVLYPTHSAAVILVNIQVVGRPTDAYTIARQTCRRAEFLFHQ